MTYVKKVTSKRSLVLIMFGVTFFLIGWSYLGMAGEIERSPAASLAYRGHLNMMPLDWWGKLFMFCGAMAALGGLIHRHVIGFTALMAVSGWWGLEFVASWAINGYTRALIGALTWLLLVGLLLVISSWPDPKCMKHEQQLWAEILGGDNER